MQMKIVVVRDIVANVYAQPMFVASIGAAIRSFADQASDTEDRNNILAKHPEHFELWELGTYNDQDGTFDLVEQKQLATGANFKK